MNKKMSSFLPILSIVMAFLLAIVLASLLLIVLAHQQWYSVLILLCLCIGIANIDIYFEKKRHGK